MLVSMFFVLYLGIMGNKFELLRNENEIFERFFILLK